MRPPLQSSALSASVTVQRAGLCVLVVDAQSHTRDLMRFLLEEGGHRCFEAADGEEALSCWRENPRLDLILLDSHLPRLDGLEVARQIRAECQFGGARQRSIGIFFMVAPDETQLLVQCVGAGADDWIPKPVNERVLMWKVEGYGHLRAQCLALKTAQARIQSHQHYLEREHRVLEQLYDSNFNSVITRCENATACTSATALWHGEVLLVAPSPAGGLFALIGQFNEQGLAVAVGVQPVMSVFYEQVRDQVSVSELAAHINRELYRVLPRGTYCCAALLHLDREGRHLSLWSGSVPDALYISADGSTVTDFACDHAPLGVLSPEEFDSSLQQHDLAYGGHLYFCTDGLLNLLNESGEAFGENRYRQLLRAIPPGRLGALERALQGFQGAGAQGNALSVLEIHCVPLSHRHKITREIIDFAAVPRHGEGLAWRQQLCFEAAQLCRAEPLEPMMAALRATRLASWHEDKIYTIACELFNNALDYGVLELDPTLKSTEAGCEHFFRLRAERLAGLRDAVIEVNLEFKPGSPNSLWLTISHGGAGFDAQAMLARGEGRGLRMLKDICTQLDYRDGGRTAAARYEFRN